MRELQNVIERAVIMSDGPLLQPHDIELPATQSNTPASPLEAAEEQTIRAALARHGGNLTLVAKELGISRPTLYARLKKYGI